MNNQNYIRIGNRSDALQVFDQLLKSIKANEDIGIHIESTCGEGSVLDCLCALQDALERYII